jgi:hypothetical protein
MIINSFDSQSELDLSFKNLRIFQPSPKSALKKLHKKSPAI